MAINIGENNDKEVTYVNSPDINRVLFKNLSEGASADEIAEAVNAWIEEHPEAVTTVQDGSILPVKLDSSNNPSDGYVLSWNATAGKFEWIDLQSDITELKADITNFTEPTKNIWGGDENVQLEKGSSNYYRWGGISNIETENVTLSFLTKSTTVSSIGVSTGKNDVQVENLSVNVTEGNRSSVTITNTDIDAIRIFLKSSAQTGATITITDIQLENGTVATSYVPNTSAVDIVSRKILETVTSDYNLAELESGENSGVTYTRQSDNTIKLNGTVSTSKSINIPLCTVPEGSYFAEIKILSGTSSSAVAVRYSNNEDSDTYWTGTNTSGSSETFTSKTKIYFRYSNGTVFNNCVVQIIVNVSDKDKTANDYLSRQHISVINYALNDTSAKTNELYLPVNLLSKYNAHSCVNKLDFQLSSSTHILAFGDSVTHGGDWGDSWVDSICDILNCTATNKAHTGALFGESVRTDTYWISTQLADTTASEWETATMVVVAAGTNDAGYDTPDSELYAKVASAITTIKANTDAPILFITPIKRGASDADVNYLELAKISGIIEHVALLNKCSVICGLNFPIPSHDQGVISGMMSGYIHPNTDGGYIYAMSVIGELT